MTLRPEFLKLLLARYTGAARTQRKPDVFDALASFPGREALPWSLGSVLGAAVARFLPCRVVGVLGAALAGFGLAASVRQIEVSPDGTLLYASSIFWPVRPDEIAVYTLATGTAVARTEITSNWFTVAADGSVLVTQFALDSMARHPSRLCVVILSPQLVRVGTLGQDCSMGQPLCAAASADRVFVALDGCQALVVFDRRSGAVRSNALVEAFVDEDFWPDSLRVAEDVLVACGRFLSFFSRREGLVVLTHGLQALHVVPLQDSWVSKLVPSFLSPAFHAPSNEVLVVHQGALWAVSLHDGTTRQLRVCASLVAVARDRALITDAHGHVCELH